MYERIQRFDTNQNAMIVIRVKTGNSKYTYFVCVFRQWRLVNKKTYNSNNISKQLEGFDNILKVISELRMGNNEVVCLGDLNIDLWPPNYLSQRHDLKTLFRLRNCSNCFFVWDSGNLSTLLFLFLKDRYEFYNSLIHLFPSLAQSHWTPHSLIFEIYQGWA